MTTLGKFTKQSAEVLDYYVDFTSWFADRTDTPTSQVTTADAGVTVVSSAITGQKVKVVISGGTSGTKYKVTVRLTTSASIVKEVDFYVVVKDT